MRILFKRLAGTVVFLVVVTVLLVPSGLSAAEITFRVIMSVQEGLGLFNPAVDQVAVRGDFNDWGSMGGGEDLLCEAENDSVWASTVTLPPGIVEYKFAIVYETSASINESVSPRLFDVGIHDTVLDLVYFNDREPDASAGSTPSAASPGAYSIISAHPNPFNDSTTLLFSLPSPGVLDVTVFDLLGREVMRLSPGEFSAGVHPVLLRFAGLSSGRYFCVGDFNGMLGVVSVTLIR